MLANNSIVIPDGNSPAVEARIRLGIKAASGSISAVNNSIYMVGGAANNPNCYGLYLGTLPNVEGTLDSPAGTLTAYNNIINIDVPFGAAIGAGERVTSLDLNYNNYDAENSANIGRLYKAGQGFTGAADLATWQTLSGQDADSISQDVFGPAGDGLGTWIGPEGSLQANLHFESYPGPDYLAPKYAGIDSDIDGDARPDPTVVMGADELEHVPAGVADWAIY